jgi:hypothetical protein
MVLASVRRHKELELHLIVAASAMATKLFSLLELTLSVPLASLVHENMVITLSLGHPSLELLLRNPDYLKLSDIINLSLDLKEFSGITWSPLKTKKGS